MWEHVMGRCKNMIQTRHTGCHVSFSPPYGKDTNKIFDSEGKPGTVWETEGRDSSKWDPIRRRYTLVEIPLRCSFSWLRTSVVGSSHFGRLSVRSIQPSPERSGPTRYCTIFEPDYWNLNTRWDSVSWVDSVRTRGLRFVKTLFYIQT